ncbi:MAG: hypothetical protein ACLUO4_06860 [Christensenellales bacterium]
MIFDEIDTGISGWMAQVVAEKMAQIAKTRQVICITHLAQLASMADTHYLIEKTVENTRRAPAYTAWTKPRGKKRWQGYWAAKAKAATACCMQAN